MQSEAIINKEQMCGVTSLNATVNKNSKVHLAITQAWGKIAPWWPLKNLIATNPLQGFEDVPFEQATAAASRYFQSNTTPVEMENINRQTIKWCQVFFDEGQASIPMPNRNEGIYQSWQKLIVFDKQLPRKNVDIIHFLKNLPTDPEEAIRTCLERLNINDHEVTEFLTLLLTTLPGWASYIKYQNEWAQGYITHPYSVSQTEYLAIRLILTSVLWLEAKILLNQNLEQPPDVQPINNDVIKINELAYRTKLLASLQNESTSKDTDHSETPDAQLIFCIDVRSEPIRRAIEAEGNYETFGFAGFFGIPALIRNDTTGECYASCPVLISPKHTIRKNSQCQNHYIKEASNLYQALKYTFTTPFILAEALGPWSGIWMTLRTLLPIAMKNITSNLDNKNKSQQSIPLDLTMDSCKLGISARDQCTYALSALRMIGMTSDFAKLVVLCGHGSTTENNAYASALDCGACGGHDGAANAKILAEILNHAPVREYLKNNGIFIPEDTHFTAALHNTTTDEINIIDNSLDVKDELLSKLMNALQKAKQKNSLSRLKNLPRSTSASDAYDIYERSVDWAQTRPEWGLARNAAFIIGPRKATKNINLDGRTFLHSYDWKQDTDGNSLTTILTAPMVVAQWINCQYLFSTLDNVAYGSGSKITHNIVGKIGIMQGNASDLMSGLSLQSIMKNDQQLYHEPLRLLTVVYATKVMISQCIESQPVLQKLFANGWVLLVCMDPTDGASYELQRNLTWKIATMMDNQLNRIH